MDNLQQENCLTLKDGVVKAGVAPAPLEGYKVCVFEETQGGTKFVRIINPGDAPLKKKILWIFNNDKKYSCVAVNCDVNLRFDFNIEDIKLAAQIEEFTLHCSVNFRVTDPEPMARLYRSDPIRRMQKEIQHKLQKNILKSGITIDDVFHNFYGIKNKILPQPVFESLYKFFGDFGAILGDIDMTYKIPDKYLEPLKKEEEYRLKTKTEYIDQDKHLKELQRKQQAKRDHQSLKRIDHEHEEEELLHKHRMQELINDQDVKDTHHQEQMEDVRSMHQFQREMPKRVITALDNAIESIDGAGSLEQVAKTSINVVGDVINKFGGAEIRENRKQIGSDTPMNLLGAEVDAVKKMSLFKEARQLLSLLSGKVEDATMPEDEKDDVLACISHLQVEVSRKEKADITIIQSYTGQLFDQLHKRRELFNHSIFQQVKEFKDAFTDFFKTIEPDAAEDVADPDIFEPHTADESTLSGESADTDTADVKKTGEPEKENMQEN